MSRKITGPVVLVVLDGWGLRDDSTHNGVALASTPNYDKYSSQYPFTTLHASGEQVGLPDGQMGNSEVGHTTIGAGHVIYQDLVRISKDASAKNFSTNPAFQQIFTHVQDRQSQLHIIGLLSSGGVHSHEDHFLAVIHAARATGLKQIILHPFLDGRDSPKTAGFESLQKLEALISSIGGCVIGSLAGRCYAMDRDTNWDRTDKSYNAIFHGQADHIYDSSISPSTVIQERYHNQIFDEHLEPIVFHNHTGHPYQVRKGDGIIFTNFRKDRAKQLSLKIMDRVTDLDLCFVTMTNYGAEIQALVAYHPETIPTTIGETVSKAGLKQVHIAETEKYPHATYYLNGGKQDPFPGETDIMIPSRKDIKTHDEAPEMRAREITDAALQNLNTDFMFINYANPDMVGHTANEPAIITAIETVDQELGRLAEAVLQHNGALLVIADHGNAEIIIDPHTLAPHTSHTTNPVPCIFIHSSYHPKLSNQLSGLRDVAPTILNLLGIEKPSGMSGNSLLQ